MTQRAITVLLTAITGPYEAAMGRASAKTAAFGATAQGAQQKAGGLGSAFGGLSGKLLAGGGLLYGLTQGAQMLMSYEDALVGVGKTTGLAGDELVALGADLTDLSKTIKGSAEDMLGIAQSAAQLGVSNDNIVQFTEVIANMASATDLTIDSAATDMARLSNILGRPIEDVEALGSSIVALGNNMATTEPEILSLATRLAAAGRLAGLADSEVVGLAAAMSELGVEAEAGGTAMSRVLNEITKAVGTGSESLEIFGAAAQMSATDFAAAWSEDPAAALQRFLEGLGRLSESDQFWVMEELGLDAARLTDVLIRTSSGADGLADAFNLANTAMAENVALAEEAATANATASAAWDNLGDAVKDFFRTAQDGEQGAVHLADFFNMLATGINAAGDAIARANQFIEDTEEATTIVRDSGTKMVWTLDEIAARAGATTADLKYLNAAASESGDAIRYVGETADDSTWELYGLRDAQQEAADAALAQKEANVELADQLRAQTDPVFALTSALDGVKDAQEAYDDALDPTTESSESAEDASWKLFDALLDLTDASLRVGDDFGFAAGMIDQLAASGRITTDQANDLRTALDEARTAAESFSGDYLMNLRIDMPAADRALLNSAAAAGGGGAAIHGPVPMEAKARGGPVSAGSLYLTGEEGPELFVPNVGGRIVPAGQTAQMMGGAGSTSTFAPVIQVTQKGGSPYDDAHVALRRLAIRSGHG